MTTIPTRTNPLAIVTLVVSLSWGPLAIPFGHVSLAQIRRRGEGGYALAKAGPIIGYAYLGVFVLSSLVALMLVSVHSFR
jgi:hypothetical protein